MTRSDFRRRGRFAAPLPARSSLAFALAVLAVLLIAFFSWQSSTERADAANRVSHTLTVLEQLEALLSNLKDAESGQRGYLLTGAERYLEPYAAARAAIPGRFASLRLLLAGNDQQLQRLATVEQIAVDKLGELADTIARMRAGDRQAALEIVRTDRGQAAMDRARVLIGDVQTDQRRELLARQHESKSAAVFTAWVTWAGSGVLLTLIAMAVVLASRDYRAARQQAWVGHGQMGLADRIQGEQRLEVLGDKVLSYLARCLDAQVGALYVRQRTGRQPEPGSSDAGSFVRVAGFAMPPEPGEVALRPGDGLLGQAVKDGKALHVTDVPEGYLRVSSALGIGPVRELLVAPASVDGTVQAVLELGFLRELGPDDRELLDRVCESLGIAVRSALDRGRLQELLDETQTQAEELQAQQEELRVSNEELEEQARALKESQVQLESQQAELEQTNSQLEGQAQILERQNDDLSRTQAVLTERAAELERASRYKSEFLANMSHELRTPLNSTLILAKLLADNRTGHLDEEEVRFAQTISDAGNDLLALINDILDLSKIESGKVEVMSESIDLARTVDELLRPLRPIAEQKGLTLGSTIEPGTPPRIETDPQRLGQILKNLLSNGLKFTASGEVSLRIAPAADGRLAFAVRDTGIGIDADQQQLIFDAFQQADGSTHRKYGGTGLGLSISRDLARLLGGDIDVQSTPGAGSVFTLTLPLAYAGRSMAPGGAAAYVSPAPVVVPSRPVAAAAAPVVTLPPAVLSAPRLPDDRDRLRPDARLILVIEDDLRFAAILRDLAHEMGYQCVLAHTAGAGLAAAIAYRPSAVLLDMNLPDHSGLGVLDQLKRNPATRHIPVHVASVADYAKEALELGAIGYALKPVKREQLVDALKRLEEVFSQGLRKVLVVEDDARQRDSIRQLLGNADVGITCVETAAEALETLAGATFDCMVMDLNLPDLSGYELLEKMSAQDGVSFPPVIVYTGQSLGRDEEQRLRRYSKSIIIKDARSPERLLDEVTLFLHQVESTLPAESQRLLKVARDRESALDGRRILVVEDDVRNIFALSSVLEPKGVKIEIARNGREALELLARTNPARATAPNAVAPVDLVLMDIMMPEMDGFTAMREIRKRPEWKKLPIIALTAKAMRDDQEQCLAAGANDYIAKPLDVEKLLSLVRVWMPR